MKKIRNWTVYFFVTYLFVVSGSLHARSIVSLATADTIEKALQLMDAFKGEAEDFRVGIPERLFDATGVNAAIITDHASSRGWEPDGFMQILSFRVYKFKTIQSEPNKFIKFARVACPTAQSLCACTAVYESRWASGKESWL
jgi:hypothetical protein